MIRISVSPVYEIILGGSPIKQIIAPRIIVLCFCLAMMPAITGFRVVVFQEFVFMQQADI